MGILDDLAQALADLAATDVQFTLPTGGTYTTTTIGYVWAPKTITPPCAVVEMPAVRRADPEEPESQLGTNDWEVDFPVVFYFDLADPEYSQQQAVATVEAFIQAVDEDGNLGFPTVLDTKVVETGPPEIMGDQTRAQIVYPTRVSLLKLVP